MLTIDIRTQNQYIKSHMVDSIFIGYTGGDFKYWINCVVPNTTTIFKVIADKNMIIGAKSLLHKLGYSNFTFITDRTLLIQKLKNISPYTLLQDIEHHKIIDVREKNETEKIRLKSSINLPLSEIVSGAVPYGDVPFYIYCVGGYRSVIAMSILNNKISSELININGGIKAIMKAPNFTEKIF